MSMKKWTDEELISTRDNLESWSKRNSSSGSKLWLLTALLGAFAISTGVVFIFFDGVDVLSIILIIMGAITCLSWYKSEKQRKDNMAFLDEINKEIKSRKVKDKSKDKAPKQEKEIATEAAKDKPTMLNESKPSDKIEDPSDK